MKPVIRRLLRPGLKSFPNPSGRMFCVQARRSTFQRNCKSSTACRKAWQADWMMEVYDNPVVQGLQPKSAIFVPMIVGDEAMGVISLQNIDRENAFSEADLRLLTTLASSMSVALENARLWEQEKLYRKALQRELE